LAPRRLFIFTIHILKSQPHPPLIAWTGRPCAGIDYRRGIAIVLIIARDGRIVPAIPDLASTALTH
jgi:hypothetical protein